jgi:hypothetical protein
MSIGEVKKTENPIVIYKTNKSLVSKKSFSHHFNLQESFANNEMTLQPQNNPNTRLSE